ncbi:MAG: tetratricopeptide repeat protein [Desulfobulbaceae bacterium]|nr:tetratricopeptide repeat protein [Desulfobulbaceae bacterium]
MKPSIDKGISLLKAGDYAEAASLLQEAASQAPENIDILAALGHAWEKLGEDQKAWECYRQALAVNPSAGKIHQGLARLHLRGPHYLEALGRIHANLRPASYIEIGIRKGASFKLASPDIPAVGIDPNPLVDGAELPVRHLIIRDTSDNYFRSGRLSSDLEGLPVDLAFIDGMHLMEFALRDFIALENSAHPGATILVHDCYPMNDLTARRKQETPFWSGDVWKLILCLKEYRKDLKVLTLPCPPTGLAVITRLDPLSTVLSNFLEEIYNTYVPMDFSGIEEERERKLNLLCLNDALRGPYLR